MKAKKQKSNKRIMGTFVLILLGSFILGACLSMLVGILQNDNLINMEPLWNGLAIVTPFLFVGLHLICCVASLILLHSAKKEFKRWDGENEAEADTAERELGWAIGLANVMTVVNFFLFGSMLQVSEHTAFGERYGVILFPITLVVFILGYVWIIAVINMSVKLTQKLNPEKQGNVFDTRFKKNWLESCDEMEKQKTYECGFRAYQTGSTVCMVMWVVATLIQLWSETGLLPQVIIFIIWLSMTLRYQAAAMKM